MAARNVNIWLSNWTDLGTTVPFPRYDLDVRMEWTDGAGQTQEWEGTVQIPNDLQLVPAAWLKEALTELIVKVLRKRLGMDE